MFAPKRPTIDVRRLLRESKADPYDRNDTDEEDGESWDETRAEHVAPEPFSLFGFNLFESEATLQVNRSEESDDSEETDVTPYERQRGFFQRIWEGPTNNDADVSNEDTESDEDYEEEDRRNVSRRGAKDDASQFIKAGYAFPSFPNVADLTPSPNLPIVANNQPTTKANKRRFWKRNRGQNSGFENADLVVDISGPRKMKSRSSFPDSNSILSRSVVAEVPLVRDRRDDGATDWRDIRALHEHYTYKPEDEGRDEQTLNKCCMPLSLRGGEGNTFLPRTSSRFCREDSLIETKGKSCFPSWPTPSHSLGAPSDLTSSTDGMTVGGAVRKSRNMLHPTRSQSIVESPTLVARQGSPKPKYVPTTVKTQQLSDMLEKYNAAAQPKQRAKPAPPAASTKSVKSNKHKKDKRQNVNSISRHQQKGSWDEHSGWFTLGSLDVV